VGPTNVFVLVLSRHKPVDRTTCSPTSAATTGIVFRAKSTGISQPNQPSHVQNLCRSQLSRFQSICDKGSFGVRLKILYIRQNSLPILMAIGKKRSRFTSIAALRSAPRRTGPAGPALRRADHATASSSIGRQTNKGPCNCVKV
jgi:hypothetical protein